jgi:sec-independent protein translocase protein TatC
LPDKSTNFPREEKQLTFFEHLGELRKSLIVSAVALLVGIVLALFFVDAIDRILRWPIQGLLPLSSSEPVFLGIFEPIFYQLKLGLIGGIILASPVVFWQLWSFVSPGLYPKERRYALPFVLIATLFFLSGVLFCYFVIFPQAAAFSLGQMTEHTRLLLSLQDYLSQVATFLLAFGLVFEVPVMVFLLSWIGIVRAATFARYRKYVFLAVFIIAAIITPTPDILNQTLMALPMYLLFELGVLSARLFERRRASRNFSPE